MLVIKIFSPAGQELEEFRYDKNGMWLSRYHDSAPGPYDLITLDKQYDFNIHLEEIINE